MPALPLPHPQIEDRGASIATVPTFLYGTAWKEAQTETLVSQAIKAGFRGIDTANQRKHYYEEGVGHALKQCWDSGEAERSHFFLQTKFTYARGQDHRLPYDADADAPTQVRQSFARSLEHLHTSYIDSYILHGPSTSHGLSPTDYEVWHTMEALQKSGAARLIGVSNISAEQLQLLLEKADIQPAFVQNRCFASTRWDAHVRALCRTHGIRYQGFSLLTANAKELHHPDILAMASRQGCTVPQLVFRFALQVGMIPLTGTTSTVHMKEDMDATTLPELSEAQLARIETIAA